MAHAVSLGIGLAISGKDMKVKNAARRLIRRAFPEVSL
jgi:transketolase C-terminal domain/subunit